MHTNLLTLHVPNKMYNGPQRLISQHPFTCDRRNRHSTLLAEQTISLQINSPPTLYIFAAIASRSLYGRTTLNTHFQSIFVATIHRKSATLRN